MRASDRRRFQLAVLFSLLAHATAAIVLAPIFALWHAVKALSKKENEPLRVALLLAILLHFLVLVPLVQVLQAIQPERPVSGYLEVDLLDAKQAAEEERKPAKILDAYEPEEEVPKGQVVSVPPSRDTRRPEDARFLAEQDSRVDRESRSRVQAPGTGDRTSQQSSQGTGQDSATVPGGMRADEVGAGPLPSAFERAEGGEAAVRRGAPPSLEDVNLEPSLHAMASAISGSGLDYLDDVIDGDSTALNTLGWRYASFFNRVKREVERYWHPDKEYRRRDPYGSIYGFKDRVTILLVVLEGDGSLKNLYVMEPSGAPFLDEEAVEAVELAAPFTNVPEGLKDRRDGLVKFTFYFLVELGEQPILRMRRYP